MKRISMLGVASVATIIIVFALMAGCRFKEPAIAQPEPFFSDTKMLMGSHRNKHMECLGEIYGFARLLVKNGADRAFRLYQSRRLLPGLHAG